jgi:hypothetical protein
MALAKMSLILAKADWIFIHCPPAKAGGNSKLEAIQRGGISKLLAIQSYQ